MEVAALNRITDLNAIIEKAGRDDLKEILDLQHLAYQKEASRYNDFTIPPLTQTIEEITEEYGSALFLKLVAGDTIIGSIRGRKDGNTCHVGRLMVHPAFQGKGLGKRLIERLESEFAADSDIVRFELFTGELSHDNISLYKSMNYAIYKKVPYDSDKSMVYMEKFTRHSP
ncbi:MAG: GNAT family N-acetyltransferase [Spirochaetes bacterium]|nr:GNAT family N-acetyltransferase [Spirochaetota bacterium]